KVRTEARREAEKTRADAAESAAKEVAEAEGRARELLKGARVTASDVRTEGLELVGNLRSMGDSLRANAERLLRDVQLVHSRMVAEIDRMDGGASRGSSGLRPAGASHGAGARSSPGVDDSAATQVFRSESPGLRRERTAQA